MKNNTARTTKVVNKDTKKIDELLIEACKSNDLITVKKLLTDKTLPYNANVSYKFSASFVEACKYGHIEVVDYLLTSQELVEHVHIDACRGAGLRSACENGHLDVVNYLLTNKKLKKIATIHINDDQALLSACLFGRLDVVKYLLTSPELKKHSNIDAQNGLALSNSCSSMLNVQPLIGVSQEKIDQDISNRLELIKFLLTSDQLTKHSDINAQNGLALIVAGNISHNNISLVKYLLTSPELKTHSIINLDDTYEVDGKKYKKKKAKTSVLDLAAIKNNIELVKFLVESPELKEKANIYYNAVNCITHAQEPTLSYLLERVDLKNIDYANEVFENICIKVAYEGLDKEYINKLVYEYDIMLTQAMPHIASMNSIISNNFDIASMITQRELNKKLSNDLSNDVNHNTKNKMKL